MSEALEELEKKNEQYRSKFIYCALTFQIVLIILFGTLTQYGDSAISDASGDKDGTSVQSEIDHLYPFYQDVHVMIFIGFGFLMTFLKKYTFSSVGFNFLIAAFAIQWSMLVNGIAHNIQVNHPSKTLDIGIENLITSDFAAGAVLITFGAVLGKVSPLQMLFVLFFELIIYAINEVIGAGALGAVDMGGSIFVHTFGAYFGLALSRALVTPKKDHNGEIVNHPLNGSSYKSDTFAMIGTLFLWMFWPSFNGALALESQQHRVVINTVLALSASCISAFIFDSLMRPHRKFDMVSIQNATLAGGVAVGSSSDLVIEPWGALFVGTIAGFVSVFGYVYIQPYLAKKIGLDDTCGVHNLHGIPGIIGAVGGAISAATAGESAYGVSIATVFPRRAPSNPADDSIEAGDGLSASQQAQIQVAALFITLAFAIVGGTLVGMVVKHPWFLPPAPKKPSIFSYGESSDDRVWFKDEMYWEVPTDGSDGEVDEDQLRKDRTLELEMLAIDIRKKEEKRQSLEKMLGNHSSEVDTVVDNGTTNSV